LVPFLNFHSVLRVLIIIYFGASGLRLKMMVAVAMVFGDGN